MGEKEDNKAVEGRVEERGRRRERTGEADGERPWVVVAESLKGSSV